MPKTFILDLPMNILVCLDLLVLVYFKSIGILQFKILIFCSTIYKILIFLFTIILKVNRAAKWIRSPLNKMHLKFLSAQCVCKRWKKISSHCHVGIAFTTPVLSNIWRETTSVLTAENTLIWGISESYSTI